MEKMVKTLACIACVCMGAAVFGQAATNHEFASSTKDTTVGIFKDATDLALDVTGFGGIENAVAGVKFNSTNLDLVWGQKFGGIFIGVGYNGNIVSQVFKNDVAVHQYADILPEGGLLGTGTITTKSTPNLSSRGFVNNATLLVGLGNMGFKFRFDSSVSDEAKRGALNYNNTSKKFEIMPAVSAKRTGSQIFGMIDNTVYDPKGFYTGSAGLQLKPHFDFGINLGMGMDLYVTAHAGVDFVNKDYYYGFTHETNNGNQLKSDTATSKNYAYNTQINMLAGAEAGVTFGFISPSLAYDVQIAPRFGKKFSSDKNTAFLEYAEYIAYTNFSQKTENTKKYSAGNAARSFSQLHRVTPAVTVKPNFGENILFGAKLKLPIHIANNKTSSPGTESIKDTTYSYAHNNDNQVIRRIETNKSGVSESNSFISLAPNVLLGIRFFTPGKAIGFNLGVDIELLRYTYSTAKRTVAVGSKATKTTYANNETTTKTEVFLGSDSSNPDDLYEYSHTKGEWTPTRLNKIRFGVTWFVNKQVTLDANASVGFTFATFGKQLSSDPDNIGITLAYKY